MAMFESSILQLSGSVYGKYYVEPGYKWSCLEKPLSQSLKIPKINGDIHTHVLCDSTKFRSEIIFHLACVKKTNLWRIYTAI